MPLLFSRPCRLVEARAEVGEDLIDLVPGPVGIDTRRLRMLMPAQQHEYLVVLAGKLSHPSSGLLSWLSMYEDSDLRALAQAHHYDRRKPLDTVLGLARERGLLRQDIPLDDLIHIFVGAVQYRSNMLVEPVSREYAANLLKLLFTDVATSKLFEPPSRQATP